ncbi:MAG: ParB/RepB/Spo0J family partition protein [Gammaproteobacteria bacterium]|nr:ParB/RepB/Spo0J family partition protein [Gammaproteobacteria bacterium]NND37978.1 ParB/RepB/Spo0J family partition protein [Pseudomonadales bacterium]MBT8152112.1 ParB/RepB/Spo0J family partition protein [Gammaproteobacteria bacterium]NNL11786.1 ParB/RepB/Spo0J family partition protein [Pseudomonadales bacterium]NNM12651.1 ParB/RepB/Spo0J family partition protein [Pseudomonadales bacterium]
MAGKKKGLGKGLEALMGGISAAPATKTKRTAQAGAAGVKPVVAPAPAQRPAADGTIAPFEEVAAGTRVLQVPVEICQRGKYQPRRAMDNQALDELAASIKNQGIMQPVILRELPANKRKPGVRYEIVAGERRWRAAQLAGLSEVPALVRELDDETASAVALVENLQREDLNPMDEAHAIARLQQDFELTHQQIADMVGRSRTAVSNALRLLGLHEKVQQMLENGDLEMGHARALLAAPTPTQPELARDVVNRNLSVRQVEALVKRGVPGRNSADTAQRAPVDANIEQLQNELADKLGVPVKVQHKSSGGGQLLLKYHSLDELDGILAHIR